MRRFIPILLFTLLATGGFLTVYPPYCLAELAEEKSASILLLVTEQNIEGPQRSWWASEIDLSTIESRLSEVLILQGYYVLDPSKITGVLRREKAFRRVNLSEEESIKLARLSKADYVVLGKAVASSGAKVPYSNMRSCFANATVKLIRVNDGSIIAYLDASSSSVHTDLITGGREALLKTAEDLGLKIINALNQMKTRLSEQ